MVGLEKRMAYFSRIFNIALENTQKYLVFDPLKNTRMPYIRTMVHLDPSAWASSCKRPPTVECSKRNIQSGSSLPSQIQPLHVAGIIVQKHITKHYAI
jgi:hypothetical protein